MKRITVILLLAISFLVACKPSKYKDLQDGLYADIETDKGFILVQLHEKEVPLTVANFVTLAEGTNTFVSDSLKGKKYFDGIKFHRVINDFMIQGGDPLGTGQGGPGYRFEDEFPKDSKGDLLYKHDQVGVLSMANSGPGTNGSQFFITHKPTPWLDGKHSVFGLVKEGQSVVDSIAKDDLIKHITILKVGSDAKRFDAVQVFETEFKKSQALKVERLKNQAEKEKNRYDAYLKDRADFYEKQDYAKAKILPSGLGVLVLKKGKSGAKVSTDKPVTMHYTLHFADGKLFQSTRENNSPFVCTIDQQPMIAGFTEGIIGLGEGAKVRLFVPYQLAWGERGNPTFPPKTDVVFDIEILKIEK